MNSRRVRRSRRLAAGAGAVAMIATALTPMASPSDVAEAQSTDYAANLALIRSSSVRNTNHDASPARDVALVDLVIEDHLGPRTDYLNDPAGNPEQHFPVSGGGQFRTSCEFSHFAYDDPIVKWGQPGGSHLHMFFGNTDTNAFSTYETLSDTGSSTCNGQELNRTGYWVPAMFDGADNVRIPERIVVYYKGEGLANGISQAYPPGAAMVPMVNINTISDSVGGADKPTFKCSDQFSGPDFPQGDTIPSCSGDRDPGVRTVLEMNVKFPQCWNGQDPSNRANFYTPARGSWYFSSCGEGVTLPNLEYFVNYVVEPGENTSDWFLASDVDPVSFQQVRAGGATAHGDWWGAWHPEVNQRFLDNCVNFSADQDSGCGMGYLTDGGPDSMNPRPGPALRFRPQYEGSSSVPAANLFAELCTADRSIGSGSEAAYCDPTPRPPVPEPDVVPDPVLGEAECRGVLATIVGTNGDDAIDGTDGDDVIWAGGGDDYVNGRGGDDIICTTSGNDAVYAGDGNDIVDTGEGYDVLDGEAGNDQLFGGRADDTLLGGSGGDLLIGGDHDDDLDGGAGADIVSGDDHDDVVVGGPGDDLIVGGRGVDTCNGSSGADFGIDVCESSTSIEPQPNALYLLLVAALRGG